MGVVGSVALRFVFGEKEEEEEEEEGKETREKGYEERRVEGGV